MKLKKVFLFGGGLTIMYISSGVFLFAGSASSLGLIFYFPLIIPLALGYDDSSGILIYAVYIVEVLIIWLIFSAFVYAIMKRGQKSKKDQ